MLLYQAFGVDAPEFVHIPTVLAPGGGKLSKREGATPLLEYRDRGYHPEGIFNYLSLLSWSSEDGEEFLTREALIERIDLDRIGAADSEVDEEKMAWLSGQHIRHDSAVVLARRWSEHTDLTHLGIGEDDLSRAAEVFAKRTQLLSDVEREIQPIFREPEAVTDEARAALSSDEAPLAIRLARDAWEETEWRPQDLKSSLRDAAKGSGIPGREFFSPIRVALTGDVHGPDLAEVAYALGRERTRARLERALERTDQNSVEETT